MSGPADPQGQLLTAFARFGVQDADALVAVKAMPADLRRLLPGSYLIREGQHPIRCALLVEGYAYRQKIAIDGQRALVGVLVPGDFIDIQNLFLSESDHDVQILTACNVVEFAQADLRALVSVFPSINAALWLSSLIEASIGREWLLNIGRRAAHARMAHLLCEMTVRREAVGIGREEAYVLPMTQEQIGDALGLTSVHVNRVLRVLENGGLIARRKREVRIADWAALRRAADFNERYLHLNAVGPSVHA